MAKLVRIGVSTPIEFPLKEGVNTVGRGVDNDLQFASPVLSVHHCEILVRGYQASVRDLGSTNGVLVDGTPVTECDLNTGQKIQLGPLIFRIDCEIPMVQIPTALPPLPVPPEPELPAGTFGCQVHPGTPAMFQCNSCRSLLCQSCVRQLRITGGQPRYFCKLCSGPAEVLGAMAVVKKSLFTRIKDALFKD